MSILIEKQDDGYQVEVKNNKVIVSSPARRQIEVKIEDLRVFDEWVYAPKVKKRYNIKDETGLWAYAEKGIIRVRDIGDAIKTILNIQDRIKKEKEAEAQKKAAAEKLTIRVFLSSRGWGDYSSIEWVGSVEKPIAEILKEAKELLMNGSDVDDKNQTDEDLISIIEKAKAVWADKNKEAKIEQARLAEAQKKAKETGEKQIINKYVSDHCMENLPDCSFDRVTIWIDAEGNRSKTWDHCY